MNVGIGGAETWAKFGLAGLVIFALFVALASLIVTFFKRYDKIVTLHKEERSEWLKSNEKQVDKLEAAINNLAAGLKESK